MPSFSDIFGDMKENEKLKNYKNHSLVYFKKKQKSFKGKK